MNCRTVCRAMTIVLAVSVIGLRGANAQPGLIPNSNVETDSEPDGTPDLWFHSGAAEIEARAVDADENDDQLWSSCLTI